jgi:hypothetical protein
VQSISASGHFNVTDSTLVFSGELQHCAALDYRMWLLSGLLALLSGLIAFALLNGKRTAPQRSS